MRSKQPLESEIIQDGNPKLPCELAQLRGEVAVSSDDLSCRRLLDAHRAEHHEIMKNITHAVLRIAPVSPASPRSRAPLNAALDFGFASPPEDLGARPEACHMSDPLPYQMGCVAMVD